MVSIKICRIVTVPFTYQTLLYEQLKYTVRAGYDVTIICDDSPLSSQVAKEVGANYVGVRLKRRPSPLSDIRSLVSLTRIFAKGRYDIVHSVTPKAGFLSALASCIAGVPVRIHTYTGQPWVVLSGIRRRIPIECDRIIARLSTACYADSHSQKSFLISEGVVDARKISVVGSGSIAGVDLKRFTTSPRLKIGAQGLRKTLGIPLNALVVLFVGRVTRDKGIVELVAAFEQISQKKSSVYLLIVGPQEPKIDPLSVETLKRIAQNQNIRCVGFTERPEEYFEVADIFCLPSYREGFGNVAVEAAAMGLPTIASRVTGLVDAVSDTESGILVSPGSIVELADALMRLIESPLLRRSLGAAGRARVEQHFDSDTINGMVVDEYSRLLMSNRGCAIPQ